MWIHRENRTSWFLGFLLRHTLNMDCSLAQYPFTMVPWYQTDPIYPQYSTIEIPKANNKLFAWLSSPSPTTTEAQVRFPAGTCQYDIVGWRLSWSSLSIVVTPTLFQTRGLPSSVADPGCLCLCLSQILIFTHSGSRISDPGSKNSNKREGWKKLVVKPFFVATNFVKFKIILFFKCWRKKFWPVFKEL